MPDIVDDVLASGITWMILRVGLEDSLTDTLVGGSGGNFNGTVNRLFGRG